MLKDISVAINKIHNIGAMAVTRLLFKWGKNTQSPSEAMRKNLGDWSGRRL